MQPMRIAILGTRGVPAAYGGFETFAEELGARLVERGAFGHQNCRCSAFSTPPKRGKGSVIRPSRDGHRIRSGIF